LDGPGRGARRIPVRVQHHQRLESDRRQRAHPVGVERRRDRVQHERPAADQEVPVRRQKRRRRRGASRRSVGCKAGRSRLERAIDDATESQNRVRRETAGQKAHDRPQSSRQKRKLDLGFV